MFSLSTRVHKEERRSRKYVCYVIHKQCLHCEAADIHSLESAVFERCRIRDVKSSLSLIPMEIQNLGAISDEKERKYRQLNLMLDLKPLSGTARDDN